MIIFSLIVCFATVLIGFFIKSELIVLIPYGIINPLLLLLPRILFKFSAKIRGIVNFEWVKKIEFFSFFIIILNAPGSLILHNMGIQYDRLLHFGAAFFAAPISFLFLLAIIKSKGKEIKRVSVLLTVFIILFALLFVWEGIQYSIDRIFGTKLFYDSTQNIRVDFLEDILFGFLGIGLSVLYFNYYFKKFLEAVN